MRLKRKTLSGLISGIFATLILCVGVLPAYAEQAQAYETVDGVDMVYLITDWVYTVDMAQTALRKPQENIILLEIITEFDVKKLDAILAPQRAQEMLSPVGGETIPNFENERFSGRFRANFGGSGLRVVVLQSINNRVLPQNCEFGFVAPFERPRYILIS